MKIISHCFHYFHADGISHFRFVFPLSLQEHVFPMEEQEEQPTDGDIAGCEDDVAKFRRAQFDDTVEDRMRWRVRRLLRLFRFGSNEMTDAGHGSAKRPKASESTATDTTMRSIRPPFYTNWLRKVFAGTTTGVV